jgi:hypothetical protein
MADIVILHWKNQSNTYTEIFGDLLRTAEVVSSGSTIHAA